MMKAELEMESSWIAIGGARLAAAVARSDTAEFADRVSDLMQLSVRGIARMYDPAGSLFPQTMRGARSESGPVLRSEGENLRYAAIVALGISRLPLQEQQRALRGSTARELAHMVSHRAVGHSDLGSVALAAWACAEVAGLPAANLLDTLEQRIGQEGQVPVVVLAWAIVAMIAGGRVDRARDFAADLMGVQGSEGIFPHTLPASAQGRLRGHVGCFADQVYPTQALSRLFLATGEEKYLASAARCGQRICALQGSQGQWWWHYDYRTGEVVEGFPVYSVHQHAMAPMALFELTEAGGPDLYRNVATGLDWLYTHPEVIDELIAPSLDVVWRKVGRKEPRKLVRGAAAAYTAIRPGGHLAGVDHLFPPAVVDHECRPYELGWLLYAWGGSGLLNDLGGRP